MNNSIIEHRANYHYIQVCEEYLLICSHGKASPHCKALILSVLEQWTNTKRDTKQPLDSIYMPYPLWEQSLYYLYSKNIIVECLKELLAEKTITRKSHRSPDGKDTYAYGLAVERVQALVKALPEKGVKDLLPRLDAFKNAPRKTRSKKDGSDAVKSDSQTQSDLNGYPVKLGSNVSSSTSSSHKESVVSPTLEQPNITHTPPAVAGDYENTAPSMQLSTATEQSVDNSHRENHSQSYSHKPATSVPTHVGVMPVLGVPMPPPIEGVKMPDAPRVQPPTPPKDVQDQPSDAARAIRRMYDRCAGYVTGHAEWEWKKMEEMARDLQEAGTPPTKDDMQLVYDHLKAVKQKHTVGHVWEAWEQLPTLKAKQVQTSTTPAGIYMPPESDLVRRMREMRESVEKKQVAR